MRLGVVASGRRKEPSDEVEAVAMLFGCLVVYLLGNERRAESGQKGSRGCDITVGMKSSIDPARRAKRPFATLLVYTSPFRAFSIWVL